MINLISYKNLLHLSIVLLQLVVGSPSREAPRLPPPQWHLYFCRSTRIQYWSSNLHYHQKYIGHNWPTSSIMLHPRPKGIITMVASVSLVIVLLCSSMNNVVLCTYDYAELLYVITSIVGGTHDHDSHEWRDYHVSSIMSLIFYFSPWVGLAAPKPFSVLMGTYYFISSTHNESTVILLLLIKFFTTSYDTYIGKT